MKIENIATNLKRCRKAKKWTQDKVAKRCYIDRTTYTKFESGSAVPSLDTCIRLCLALDVSPNELMGWGDATDTLVSPTEEECEAALQPFPAGLSEEEIDTVTEKIKEMLLEISRDKEGASSN